MATAKNSTKNTKTIGSASGMHTNTSRQCEFFVYDAKTLCLSIPCDAENYATLTPASELALCNYIINVLQHAPRITRSTGNWADYTQSITFICPVAWVTEAHVKAMAALVQYELKPRAKAKTKEATGPQTTWSFQPVGAPLPATPAMATGFAAYGATAEPVAQTKASTLGSMTF